jgi:hypothetical protein
MLDRQRKHKQVVGLITLMLSPDAAQQALP